MNVERFRTAGTLIQLHCNLYFPVQGYVNLGTSVSALCDDVILKRVNEPCLFKFDSKEQHYFPMWGIPEFREAIASCLTRHLAPNSPVLPENVSS
jgi:hypothetical protein